MEGFQLPFIVHWRTKKGNKSVAGILTDDDIELAEVVVMCLRRVGQEVKCLEMKNLNPRVPIMDIRT